MPPEDDPVSAAGFAAGAGLAAAALLLLSLAVAEVAMGELAVDDGGATLTTITCDRPPE
jgi:hypothetical protein